MPFLDWTKNRSATIPPETKPDVPKTQTARDFFSQRNAQEKANEKPLTPEVKEQADRAMASIDKATWSLRPQEAPSQSDAETRNEPMRQAELNQGKTAPALSPTTEQVGRSAEALAEPLQNDQGQRTNRVSPNRSTPDDIIAEERAGTIEKSQQVSPAPTPRTQSRDRGGWER
jgi:hypothetical protein